MTGVCAVVLAGGESLRLGRDKALLRLYGKTMLERTVDLARQAVDRVYVSGRDPGPLGFDAPWFPDDTARIGPMGGVFTALVKTGSPCLVLSCDLPLLRRSALDALLRGRLTRQQNVVMTTFRHADTGFIESLVAVYEPGATDYLRRAMERGMFQLSRAVPETVRLHLPFPEEEADAFFNINRPEDVERLRELSVPIDGFWPQNTR